MIPVVDVFAGPGGLAEGFSSVEDNDGERYFDISLSVECDNNAFQTLLLRSFLRQFPLNAFPEAYYAYYRDEISLDELYRSFPTECKQAKRIAWLATLGEKDCPHNILDQRISLAIGESPHWVLIGGPPCQAYSTAGRSRNKGNPDYKPEDDHRHFLYKEYLRILGAHKPSVFIMENVKGMLSAKVGGELLFHKMLHDLANPTEYLARNGVEIDGVQYHLYSCTNGRQELSDDPRKFVIRSEDYGIPQARHRVIIMGIRADIPQENITFLEQADQVPVESVLGGLPPLRSGLSKEPDSDEAWCRVLEEMLRSEWLIETELKFEGAVYDEIVDAIQTAVAANLNRGGEVVRATSEAGWNPAWMLNENLNSIRHHATRGHMTSDLSRYIFVSGYASVFGQSPRLEDFPDGILPAHKNAKSGKFNDRFRTQHYGVPAKTITSHISQDGHYFIHPDPTQCRSLTVREAARIQTFPDDYIFSGGRTSQFHQVGNAVPPYLAFQIAQRVSAFLQELE